MIIDTDKCSTWVQKHSTVCIPVATSSASWYLAMRWQAAINHNEVAMAIFYFCFMVFAGITSMVLITQYFDRIGLFK